MIQRLPRRSPTFTVFVLTTLSAPTTRSWNEPWSSVTARCGTSSASSRTRVSAWTRPYSPGRSMRSGLGNAALIRIVPVFASISRSAARNTPLRG